jgi:mRNA-degrading endonuclease RelE of RelBE toxin-antitoxin system
MKLIYANKVKKQLKKLLQRERIKILRNIIKLEHSPFLGKKLEGKLQGRLSLKIWPYRVIYQVVQKEKIILISTIEHRQGVYK